VRQHRAFILIANLIVASTILFFWVGGLDAFNYSKASIFTTGIYALCLTAMFTSKFLFNREFYKKTESFLLFSILCLLIIAFSHDVTDMGTLWGQFGRANGIMPRIGLYLLVLIYLYFGSRETVKVFFRSISIVLVFEIVYGFIQLAKLDFFDWNNPYGDIFITTGNPNFASSLVGILTLLNTRNFYFSNKFLTGLIDYWLWPGNHSLRSSR
jgi:hypothetical protein